MLTLPPGLASHLQEAATTTCRCWTLRRRDGVTLGFTDHDRDLVVAGQAFAARSGLEAAEATSELGFAVGGGDVSGALVSDFVAEDDILAGLYDDAGVEVRLVNWADPTEWVLLSSATIGEIRRADDAFVAELRGPMHRLDEEQGLTYRAACSADLGDARCKIDLDDPAWSASALVADTDGGLSITALGLSAYPSGRFTGGRLLWLDGAANAGGSVEVKLHRSGDVVATLELWQRALRPIAAGDPFRVTAGCDKQLTTCSGVFDNVVNHRGFPHMPGNDFILKVPLQGEAGLDGGSFFR